MTFIWLTSLRCFRQYNKAHILSPTIMDEVVSMTILETSFPQLPRSGTFQFHDCGSRNVSELFVLCLESKHVHPPNTTRRTMGLFFKGGYHAETYFSMLGSHKLIGTRDPPKKDTKHFDGGELKWVGKKRFQVDSFQKAICWCAFALYFYMFVVWIMSLPMKNQYLQEDI